MPRDAAMGRDDRFDDAGVDDDDQQQQQQAGRHPAEHDAAAAEAARGDKSETPGGTDGADAELDGDTGGDAVPDDGLTAPHHPTTTTAADSTRETAATAAAAGAVTATSAGVAGNEIPATPVALADRVRSLDVLRGVAVLGILVMNIQSFALPDAAYAIPKVYGDLGGLNGLISDLADVLARLKFMAIFSMLFGAGILLMTDRAEATDRSPAGLHYKRMFFLGLIGLAHAYLLWHGDILFTYAICGCAVFLLRHIRPSFQVVIGLLSIGMTSLLWLSFGFMFTTLAESLNDADLAAGAEDMRREFFPDPGTIAQQIEMYRGSYAELFGHRAYISFYMQTAVLAMWTFWRVSGLMLIGMALYRWGVLGNRRSTAFYIGMLALGFGIGIPLCLQTLNSAAAVDYEPLHTKFYSSQWNYWGSLFVAAGWIAVVMLACRFAACAMRLRAGDVDDESTQGDTGSATSRRSPMSLAERIVFGGFGSVGRMAFTNYLMQTIICTFIFYGWGLGAFAKLERAELAVVVLLIWLMQLSLSPWWLRRFRYGPAEWLWRSMTYGRLQPMRRRDRATVQR